MQNIFHNNQKIENSSLFDTAKEIRVSKNSTLQNNNESADYVYLLTEGVAREHLIFDDGRDVNIYFWSAPTLISSSVTLKPDVSPQTNLTMVTAGKYKKLSMKTFLQNINHYPNYKDWMNEIFETQNYWLRKRFLFLSHISAEDRVRDFALTFPCLFKTIPDYHIASYLGITPVTMHRAKAKVASTLHIPDKDTDSNCTASNP